MTKQEILKKDYILLLLLSVMYFLTVKEALSASIYIVFALLVSLYFFPIKLLLGTVPVTISNKKKVIILFSYFIISGIIALTVLTRYEADFGLFRTTIAVYGLINFGFLIYFFVSENVSYNFILTLCAGFLTSAAAGLAY